MSDLPLPPALHSAPTLVRLLAACAILGCLLAAGSVVIADIVVPDHDWVSDTISDLGAGRYEFIVDSGLYAFSAALVCIAILAAHIHLGGRGWSFGIVAFALMGLIVFLVGARNEYGDSDSEGVVIHVYLVYALGVLMAAAPFAMAGAAGQMGRRYAWALRGIAVLWTLTAPVFFFLPTGIDGVYERGLGLLAIACVCVLAHLFRRYGRALS
ncbi:DUF998 domain-containing protein [Leisingera methylohalidivorans]|uniref:Membrane protein n=1 Tax=Leisingera methylohalidivorans DSM 14336 TaxID=999552 RepID=V9VTH2_9RHOB|nr:DUF998 domain-containing protein [Leisingera methylohalidivorans]AHD01293.1 membrane protein [Leisingera methylohalidivorans DSM 14336]